MVATNFTKLRGGSRAAASSKFITKRSILNVAASLDPPLKLKPSFKFSTKNKNVLYSILLK